RAADVVAHGNPDASNRTRLPQRRRVFLCHRAVLSEKKKARAGWTRAFLMHVEQAGSSPLALPLPAAGAADGLAQLYLADVDVLAFVPDRLHDPGGRLAIADRQAQRAGLADVLDGELAGVVGHHAADRLVAAV